MIHTGQLYLHSRASVVSGGPTPGLRHPQPKKGMPGRDQEKQAQAGPRACLRGHRLTGPGLSVPGKRELHLWPQSPLGGSWACRVGRSQGCMEDGGPTDPGRAGGEVGAWGPLGPWTGAQGRCGWDTKSGVISDNVFSPGRKEERPQVGGRSLQGKSRDQMALGCVIRRKAAASAALPPSCARTVPPSGSALPQPAVSLTLGPPLGNRAQPSAPQHSLAETGLESGPPAYSGMGVLVQASSEGDRPREGPALARGAQPLVT